MYIYSDAPRISAGYSASFGSIGPFSRHKSSFGPSQASKAPKPQFSTGFHPYTSPYNTLYPASLPPWTLWRVTIFADGAYAGKKLKDALARLGQWTIEIIRRSDTAKGFELLPRRWVVERTFAWLGRNRRLAKDFEQTIASAQCWLFTASVQLLTRRIARLCY